MRPLVVNILSGFSILLVFQRWGVKNSVTQQAAHRYPFSVVKIGLFAFIIFENKSFVLIVEGNIASGRFFYVFKPYQTFFRLFVQFDEIFDGKRG